MAVSAFGMLLRRHRLAAGLSQEALAELARLSSVGVSALERGDRRSPYRETVALLAKALRLSPAAAAEFEAAAARPRQPRSRVDAPAAASNHIPSAGGTPPPNNLPPQFTSFVGRETEVVEIAALLGTQHLVTIVGSGGVGKTRTSLQVAARLLDGWSDGVWFIELAPLTNGEYVSSTVAQALGITLAAEGDPAEDLARALKGKRALLVFDNCEHIVAAVARVVSTILRSCPKVKVIASSRQGLGIAAEATYRLPSLDVPNQEDVEHVGAGDAMQFAAIALFVERARSVDRNFAFTDEIAPNVAGICRRLDGIPLAIELAAARVKLLSPLQLRARLDARFHLLTGGSRDVLPRQQTLRALIDWSYDLLEERERTLFRRLGIFVKGFTLEAAISVGSDAKLDEPDIFDTVASLVDKSLLLAEPDGDSVRYRLLESTRVYALEKLADAGERDLLAGRHLRYLQNRFAELWARRERSGRDIEMQEALATELEDVRSALDLAFERSDVVQAASLLADIGEFWKAPGLDAEGMARCETYIAALPAGESRLLARLSSALTYGLSGSAQKTRAVEVAQEAVAYARASGHAPTLAEALHRYTIAATLLYRLDDAERALAEAEAIPGATVNMRIGLLTARALYSWFRGDLEAGARSFERLRQKNHELGNTFEALGAASSLAEIQHASGQTERAITTIREALAVARSSTAKGSVASYLTNLAGYLAAVDDLPGAVAAAREAIELNIERDADHTRIAIALEHIALVCALGGDLARAATLDGYAEAAFARNGFEREWTERMTHDRLAALLLEELAPDELARLATEGRALTAEAAVASALDDT